MPDSQPHLSDADKKTQGDDQVDHGNDDDDDDDDDDDERRGVNGMEPTTVSSCTMRSVPCGCAVQHL